MCASISRPIAALFSELWADFETYHNFTPISGNIPHFKWISGITLIAKRYGIFCVSEVIKVGSIISEANALVFSREIKIRAMCHL